jgi:guanosine-3',5'-bis(diphosphate) 3'-pyrophosphohydrolase
MNDRIKKAHDFAKEKHKDQKRKFTGKAYLTHLENTANLLWQANEDVETDSLVAALLHDTVEDTQTTFKEIDQNFGREVRNLVEELTSNKKEQNIIGKAIYLTDKVNKMSEKAFTIKLCDRLDNVMDLINTLIQLEFTTRYIEETKFIIINLDREINGIQKYLLNKIKSMLLYLELTTYKEV